MGAWGITLKQNLNMLSRLQMIVPLHNPTIVRNYYHSFHIGLDRGQSFSSRKEIWTIHKIWEIRKWGGFFTAPDVLVGPVDMFRWSTLSLRTVSIVCCSKQMRDFCPNNMSIQKKSLPTGVLSSGLYECLLALSQHRCLTTNQKVFTSSGSRSRPPLIIPLIGLSCGPWVVPVPFIILLAGIIVMGCSVVQGLDRGSKFSKTLDIAWESQIRGCKPTKIKRLSPTPTFF